MFETPPRPSGRKDSAARGNSIIAPLSLEAIGDVPLFPLGNNNNNSHSNARPSGGGDRTAHQHIQAQDASSAIQQLLGVEEVEILNRIYLMEGLVPVMTSSTGSGGGGGGGSRASSPTGGGPSTSINPAPMSSSTNSPPAAAAGGPADSSAAANSSSPGGVPQPGSTSIDAAAAGTLCLTVARFIEALIFVVTFRRKHRPPTSTTGGGSTLHGQRQFSNNVMGSPSSPALLKPTSEPQLHLSTLLQQDAHSASMIISSSTTGAIGGGGGASSSGGAHLGNAGPINVVADALCADTPASRALLRDVISTWTMQIATQVEGVRARREDLRTSTAISIIPQAPPRSSGGMTFASPPPSAGDSRPTTSGTDGRPHHFSSRGGFAGGGEGDDLVGSNAAIVQEVDLAVLFPPSNPSPPTITLNQNRSQQQQYSPRRGGGGSSQQVPAPSSPGLGGGHQQSGAAATAAVGFSGGGQLKLVVKWSDFTSSFIRDAEHKDSIEDQASDLTRLSKNIVRCPTHNLHLCCPTVAIVTTTGADGGGGGGDKRKLITGGPDGLVKVWSAATNAYERTISNSGSAWVVGLALLQPLENFLVIATSNGQLTVVEFPGGAVVQKYIGCVSVNSAVSEVNVLSVLHTKKYGMAPGESGPRQVRFNNVSELSQESFTEKRRLARGATVNRSVAVKPIVGGFVNPTTMEYLPDRGLCFFGTVDGKVGCFDITEDLRQTTLITGSAVRAIHVSFATAAHLDAVTCIRYAPRAAMLLTAGMDGCIYKISLEGAGMKWVAHASPQRHNTQEQSSRPVVGMEWSEPLQLLVSFTSDRTIKFWSLMRSEPLHVMDALPCDIKSMIFIGTDRLGVLTLDKTVYVYDLRTFRLLQTMIQSTTGENSGTVLDSSSATIMRSGGDAGGCLQYHPDREALICCLRSPVQYAPAALVLASGNGSATSQLTLRSATKKSAAAATKQQQQQSGDATQQKPSTISPGISPRHAALPRHPQRVIGLAYQRHTQTLYSIDGDHLFLWNVANGECNAWSNVARQVRKATCPPHLLGKAMQMTSCTWAGSEAVRLVTGTQVGAILTWSPSGTSVLSVDAVGGSAPSSSSTDVSCCATSGSHVLVAIGNKAHLITYDTSMVLADGNRRTTTRTLTLDSPASIMSVCFLRETALVAIGTVDAVLHLCNLDSMKILETQRLKDREGRDEVSSVESIILLQRRKQNVALLLLEDGAVNVYHLGKRAVVFHARLFRKHEARFHAACVSSHEERLYVGDSLGRMFVYDIGSITSSTDFKITAASLANPCIKYLYHTQATLDGLTSMISVDVGQIASTAAYGSSAMMRDNSYQQHNSMYPSSAAATAPATPMNTLTSGMSYYQHPAHNNHHHHHHNSGTSMTLGVNHLNANNNLNSSTSTPSLAYSLLPPVSVTVDAIVVGCGDGHIRCFAASHTEAIHVGTLGDPIYGRWDWTDASTFAAEMLPKMEKDTFDDASEAFLDDILREATKKQTADTAAEVSAAAASPPSSPHRNGGGNNMSNALVVVDGENAKQQPLVTTTTSPSGESDAATSHPTASTYHQHRTPQRGRASVTKLPAVPAAAAILSKSVSPRKTVVVGGQQQQQQQGPPLTPPSQETSPLVVVTAPIIVTTHHAQPQPQHSGQQLHVRKRFIKPADIDLGNGRFITDHATEKKLLLLHYDNNHFAQQIMNSNNSYSTRSCDQSALMALPPSSYSAGGGRPPGGGAAGPKILLGTSGSSISGGGATCVGGPVDHNHNNSSISPSSPFQLSNAAEHNFFITSLAVSMEHESGATPALHSEGVGGLRGVVVPTTSRPQQQQQQQHRRSIDSSVDGQSTQEGLSPLTPGIGLLNPRQPNTKQQKGHHHGANSVQSSRSLVAERTLVPTHTVHLFDTNSVSEAALVVAGGTTTTTKQSSTAATDPQIEGVNSSASLGTTVDDSAPLPLPSFAGDHPLPPRTVGGTATGSGGGQQRRASNARRRSNAESTLSLMYRVNSTITIDMPSTPLPPPMPPTSEGGHTDEETARHHTRALLQQMAYRLDRVRPRGSMEGRFGRRVDRLYETAEEKKNRQTRRKEYLQRKQQGGVAVMGGVVSSDDEDVKVGSGGEDNEPSAGALGIVATLDGQVSLPLVLPAIEGAISSPLSAQPAGGSGHQEGFYDDMEDEDEEDDDDILASIRSPQTAKNILAVEEKLRLYKKARETGPAMAVIAQGGGGAQGTGGASSPQSSRGGGGKKQPTPNVGGFARGDPAWLTRVSSQLVMQDVSFTIPSTQVQSMGANGMLSPQRGGGGGRGGVNGMLNAVTSFSMQSNAAGGGGGKTALANTGSGAGGVSSTTTGPTSSSSDRTGSLHRGISLFGFHQPPAPPNSAPGTSRRRSTVLGGTLPAYAVTGPTPPKTAR